MYRIFNLVIIIFSIILLSFSFITFVIIQLDLFEYDFDFSPKGLNTYLEHFANYTSLFAATITLIVAYFGIKRFEAAETANKDKIKLDRFADWKLVTDIRITEIENNNKRFKREFYKIRYNLFSELYSKNLSILNKTELEKIFDLFFKDKVNFLEEMTEKHIGMGGIYRNKEYTFFFDDLNYVLVGSLDDSYSEIYKDFKTLYLSSLKKNRTINEQMFQSALTNYTGVI